MRSRVPRWVIGAMVLPVAVLASVATSRMDDDHTSITVDPAGDWYLDVAACFGGRLDCGVDERYSLSATGLQPVPDAEWN